MPPHSLQDTAYACGSWLCIAMLSAKQFLQGHKSRPPQGRLRDNISDHFLSGAVSAKRARLLYADATGAEAKNVKDLAVAEDTNIHRNLLSKLCKRSKWPRPYTCVLPMHDPATQKIVQRKLAVLLPHELHWAILKWNVDSGRNFLLDWQCARKDLKQRTVSAWRLECMGQLAVILRCQACGLMVNQ